LVQSLPAAATLTATPTATATVAATATATPTATQTAAIMSVQSVQTEQTFDCAG